METRAVITRVVLENYKSIAFCDVKLGPLSILVGPNGAGKSNFVDALRFLSDVMNGPVEAAFQNREGFSNVLRRGAISGGHLGLRLEFVTAEATAGLCSVRFAPGGAEDYIFEREKCDDGRVGVDGRVEQLGASGMVQLPKVASARQLVGGCRFYSLVPGSLRQPAASSKERVLNSNGSNLANVVHHISQTNSVTFERITQYLKAIYPALQAVESTEAGGYRVLQFRESNEIFHSLQISDGTLRSLAVLVALFQRMAGAENVSVVGLEEPETGLAPSRRRRTLRCYARSQCQCPGHCNYPQCRPTGQKGNRH